MILKINKTLSKLEREGISQYYKEHLWKTYRKHHSEKSAIYKPGSEPSPECEPCWTLILDFQPPEMEENKFPWLRPYSLWYCYTSLSRLRQTLWGKTSLYNKWCQSNLYLCGKKWTMTLPYTVQNIHSKWTSKRNVKSKTIKLLEENIKEII